MPSTAERDRGIKLERYRHFDVPEYWIVDLDARAVEVWRFADGATEPEVMDAEGYLRWTPVVEGPTLEVAVGELLP